MALKPITVAQREYKAAIYDLTNYSGLPAFVMIDVLERVVNQLRPLVDEEYKKDSAEYQAAIEAENADKAENQPESDEQ